MLFASVIMMAEGVIGILNKYNSSVLFLFFGAIGGFMTINDFLFFTNFKKNKKSWIKIHLGRMIGALIASITAFIIAGLNIGTLSFWLAPSILGTVYIIYWKRKIGKKVIENRV